MWVWNDYFSQFAPILLAWYEMCSLQDGHQMQIEVVAIFFIYFGAHMNILSINKVKILILVLMII